MNSHKTKNRFSVKAPYSYSIARFISAKFILALFFLTLSCCLISFDVLSQETTSNDNVTDRSSNYQIIVSARKSVLKQNTDSINSTSKYLGQSDLSNLKRGDLSALSNSLPGLNYAGGTSRPRFFQLRGIGERELFEGIPSSSVRVIYDDIDFSGISSAISLFDIDEIATLYGPQSFAVGPSAYAGALTLHSSDPTNYSTGKVETGGGTNDSFDGGLAVGGKLINSDSTRFRLSVNKNYVNGFRRNVFLDRDDTNQRDGTSVRLKFDFDFSEDTTGEFMYLFADMRDGYDAFTIDNNLTTESDRPGFDTQRTNAVKFKLKTSIGKNSEITNIMAFVHTLQKTSYDADWGNDKFWAPYTPYDYAQDFYRNPRLFSHELRYKLGKSAPKETGSSEFELGTYSSYRTDGTNSSDYFAGEVTNNLTSKIDAFDVSPFVRYQYTLTKNWVLDIGGRIQQSNLKYNDSRDFDRSLSDQLVGTNLSIRNYKDDKLKSFYYATISLGEKPGGINPGIAVPQDRRTFDSEKLWNFEIGSRDSFFSDDLTTNLSLFYGERKSQQVRTSFQSDPTNPAAFAYFSDNAASGNLYGLDTEAIWRATDRLKFRINAELLRTNIYDYSTPTGSINGRDQSYAPNWAYSAGGDYSITQNIYVGSRIVGKGSFYFDEPNLQRSKAYHLIDAHLGYAMNSWNFEIWGKNIFDREYETRGFYFGNEPPNFENKRYVQLGDPAWFGVTARYEW